MHLRIHTRGELPLPFTESGGGEITGQFAYSTDGQTFHSLGDPFELHPGRWIGARLGLFCVQDPPAPSTSPAPQTFLRIHAFTVSSPTRTQ